MAKKKIAPKKTAENPADARETRKYMLIFLAAAIALVAVVYYLSN